MPYVYSTLSTDVTYAGYSFSSGGHPKVERRVLVRGKANVATKQLWTPKGVSTEVTENDLDFLQEDEVFKLHVANGYITFDKRKADPEVVAKKMTPKDESAPKTPDDKFTSPTGEVTPEGVEADRSGNVRNKIK